MSLDVYLTETRMQEVDLYTRNITHNLGAMAKEAGIYQHLWRPEEVDITKAGQLVQPLQTGLAKLLAYPDHFKRFNPENGWGTYEGLVHFVMEYVEACEANPNADVRACR